MFTFTSSSNFYENYIITTALGVLFSILGIYVLLFSYLNDVVSKYKATNTDTVGLLSGSLVRLSKLSR
jgi:hypothetical protein